MDPVSDLVDQLRLQTWMYWRLSGRGGWGLDVDVPQKFGFCCPGSAICWPPR